MSRTRVVFYGGVLVGIIGASLLEGVTFPWWLDFILVTSGIVFLIWMAPKWLMVLRGKDGQE